MSKETKIFFLDKDYNEIKEKEKAIFFEEIKLDDNKLVSSTIGKVGSIKKEK